MNFYSEQLVVYSKHHKTFKQYTSVVSILRLITVIAVLGTAYLSFKTDVLVWPVLTFSGIILFLILVKLHQRFSHKADYYAKGMECLNDEITFLETGIAGYDSGAEFQQTSHPYAYDLDIFGEFSIFHYLNRTTQITGKSTLAGMLLSHAELKNIIENRQAIKELSTNPEWRLEFTATGKLHPDNEVALNKLKVWSMETTPLFGIIQRILFYLLPFLFISCVVLSYLTTNELFGAFAKLLFFVNLLLLAVNVKSILKETVSAGKAVKSILNYARLLQLIENKTFESEKLISLKAKLNHSNKGSDVLIKEFANSLSQCESIQNALGAIIFNGVFLYHLHAFSKLLKWKQQYAAQIPVFLEVIGEFEALNSLANFAYNNPEYTYPELNESQEISFKNLGHPLIHPQKRVSSDVSFNDNPFIILTGSNMSGKSTFLRALGVNMVLAGSGAPVCATACQYYPLPLFTCMRMNDSLADNESYFFAELKRLKEMILYLRNKGKCFILLDEILRGTNSDDKQSGTLKLIEQIIENKGIGIIATHDLEVCTLTYSHPDYLQNSCFEVEIVDNKLLFDYKLRPGICKNKSASFLMKQMEIIKD